MTAVLRLQKPPRIYVEKSLGEIFQQMGKPIPTTIDEDNCPGDRDDNQWITIDGYQPVKTQIEWEETCFLGKSYSGYYCWPKMIKYTMNKRDRYTRETMTSEVAIIYDRFLDKNFVARMTQLMVLGEKSDEKKFNRIQFSMFKVDGIVEFSKYCLCL